MAKYSVHIEIGADGSCEAHVEELVGCFAYGRTVEEALARLGREIPRFLAWLKEQGEIYERPGGEPELDVVERVQSDATFPTEVGGPAVDFFTHDASDFAESDFHSALRVLDRARQELLAFLQGAPPELLQWRPAPDSPSIAESLQHMAGSEAWLLSRLDDAPAGQPLLMAVRGWTYQRLLRMSEGERSRVLSHGAAKWSARKVLRRLLEHEREHADEIRALLSDYGRREERQAS